MHPVSGNLPTSSWSQQTYSNALCCIESQNALYICSKPSKHRHSCGHPQSQGLSNPTLTQVATAGLPLHFSPMAWKVLCTTAET